MKNPLENKDNGSERRIFQEGTFSILTSLILLTALLFFNLAADRLPSYLTQVDISASGLFELSGETEEILSRMIRDTDIYWIVQSGQENSEIETLLHRYEDQNDKIHVRKIDPIVNPNFTDQFTGEIILDNSLIVAAGTRSRYISYNDIFTQSYDYYNQGAATTYFDGESKLSSAIDYVNDGAVPKIRRITGHGEAVLSIAFEEALDRQNYVLENLNTLSLDTIPADTDCLLMAGPTNDISEKEASVLDAYLQGGGSLLLFTDYEHTALPHLTGVLGRYGITVEDGLVLETDHNLCYSNYPMQLLPGIVSHDITVPILRSGYLILVPMAHGLRVPSDAPAGVTLSTLLRTSDGAYAKEGRVTTLSKGANDADGPFAVGVAIEERLSSGHSRSVWFSTSQILNKEYDAIVNGVNTDLVLNALGWLTENENGIKIRSKQISGGHLTIPAGAVSRIGAVLIGVIPLCYLLIGALIMMRRRRK